MAGPLRSLTSRDTVTVKAGKNDIMRIIPGTDTALGISTMSPVHRVPESPGHRELCFIVREPRSLLTFVFVVIVLRQSLSLLAQAAGNSLSSLGCPQMNGDLPRCWDGGYEPPCSASNPRLLNEERAPSS